MTALQKQRDTGANPSLGDINMTLIPCLSAVSARPRKMPLRRTMSFFTISRLVCTSGNKDLVRVNLLLEPSLLDPFTFRIKLETPCAGKADMRSLHVFAMRDIG